jgi:glutamine amidotransferase
MLGLVGPPRSVDSSGEAAGLPVFDHLVAAPNALRRQALCGAVPPGDPPGHEDSWGVGWFDDGGHVSLLRQVGSARDSAFYVFATEAAVRRAAGSGPARVLIGHLRKASLGAVVSDNAHPIRIDTAGAGTVLVAHNGTVREPLLAGVRDDVRAQGYAEASSDCDTVVLAAWLAGHLSGADDPVEAAGAALERLVARAAGENYTGLNLLVALPDGLLALRQFAKNGHYYTLSARALDDGGWIVASEPTDDRPDWEPLTPGELSFFSTGGAVRTRRIA